MTPPPHAGRPSRARRLRRTALVAGGVILVLLSTTGWSALQAVRAPGEDGATVKLAEWGRDHGLGAAVTALESLQYRLNPPAVGGTPDLSVLAQAATQGGDTSGAQVATAPTKPGPALLPPSAVVPLHPSMATPVTPALKGEGVFTPVGSSGAHRYVQTAFVRPDSVHTSYLTGVAWMSHLDRFVLHPGYQDPGPVAKWSQPDQVASSATRALLATFNGGFKMKDANGGYYDHGSTAGSLRNGAASLVIYADGHATVGVWGKDVRMTPQVAYVRQNLKPLVQGGVVAANLDANVESTWGATIGGDLAVWRSGLGVTSTGDLVYAMGDALSVQALADVLHKAGAVTAMQLDINQAWVSFMSYHGTGSLVPRKLGSFQRPADRYLHPVSRDFIAVYSPISG